MLAVMRKNWYLAEMISGQVAGGRPVSAKASIYSPGLMSGATRITLFKHQISV